MITTGTFPKTLTGGKKKMKKKAKAKMPKKSGKGKMPKKGCY